VHGDEAPSGLVKGAPHELLPCPTVRAGRPGLGLRDAEPPAGFTDTFASRYVDAGELRLHAVICGKWPPLLLVHGWPET